MQELLHDFYVAFVDKYYDDENKCTHPNITKAILFHKNQGITVTLKNGNKYRIISERIVE